MPKPPDNLMEWPKAELVKELERLRAIMREHAEQVGGDPKTAHAPDSIVGGTPYGQGDALIDARSAVLMDYAEVVLVDTKQGSVPVMMLRIAGRINYTTDRADHVYLFGPDGGAAIVSELFGLAQRASKDTDRGGYEFARQFRNELRRRMRELP